MEVHVFVIGDVHSKDSSAHVISLQMFLQPIEAEMVLDTHFCNVRHHA